MDLKLFYFLNSWVGKSASLDFAFIFLAKYLGYLVVVFFVAYIFLDRRLTLKQKIAWYILAVISVGIARGILTEIIRHFDHSLRPFMLDGKVKNLIPEDSYSFPSGHTIAIFAIVTIAYFYKKNLGWWLGIGGLIVGLARVIVGVHWPSDIVGGVILGILVSIVFYKLLPKKFKPPLHS